MNDNVNDSTEKETGNESIENKIKKAFQRITMGTLPEPLILRNIIRPTL